MCHARAGNDLFRQFALSAGVFPQYAPLAPEEEAS